MAINKTIECIRCGKRKTETRSSGDHGMICRDCERAEDREREDDYITKFCAGVPLEKRVENIERALYRLSQKAQEIRRMSDSPIG